MTDCCDTFGTTTVDAIREANPIWRAHDECGDKAVYKGNIGDSIKAFMPVQAGMLPGVVVPAPDGINAIGVAWTTVDPVVTGDEYITVVRRAAVIKWADMAAAVGGDPLSAAGWWAYHVNLAKIGIFVTFE